MKKPRWPCAEELVLTQVLPMLPAAVRKDTGTKLKAQADEAGQRRGILRPFPPTPQTVGSRSRGAAVLKRVLFLRGGASETDTCLSATPRIKRGDGEQAKSQEHPCAHKVAAAVGKEPRHTVECLGPHSEEDCTARRRDAPKIAAPAQAGHCIYRRRVNLRTALALRRPRPVPPQPTEDGNRNKTNDQGGGEQNLNEILITSPPRPPARPPARQPLGFRRSAFKRVIRADKAAVDTPPGSENPQDACQAGPVANQSDEAEINADQKDHTEDCFEASRLEAEVTEAQRLAFVLNLSKEEATEEHELETVLNLSMEEQNQEQVILRKSVEEQNQEQVLMRKSVEEQNQEQTLLRMSMESQVLYACPASSASAPVAHDMSISLEDSSLDVEEPFLIRKGADANDQCRGGSSVRFPTPDAREKTSFFQQPFASCKEAEAPELMSLDTGLSRRLLEPNPADRRGEKAHSLSGTDSLAEESDSADESCGRSALCEAVASQIVAGLLDDCAQALRPKQGSQTSGLSTTAVAQAGFSAQPLWQPTRGVKDLRYSSVRAASGSPTPRSVSDTTACSSTALPGQSTSCAGASASQRRCKALATKEKLIKLLLRYDPPGLGLQYRNDDGIVAVRHKALPSMDAIFAKGSLEEQIEALVVLLFRSDGDLLRPRHRVIVKEHLWNVYAKARAIYETQSPLDSRAQEQSQSAIRPRAPEHPPSTASSSHPNPARRVRFSNGLAQTRASPSLLASSETPPPVAAAAVRSENWPAYVC